MGSQPSAGDQITDATTVRGPHADVCRDHAAFAWVVLWDLSPYPKRLATKLATGNPVSFLYRLLAGSLAEIRAWLPPGLVRSGRMPADAPEVMEIRFC